MDVSLILYGKMLRVLCKFDLGGIFQEYINCTNLDIPVLSEVLLSSENTSLSLHPRVYMKRVFPLL